ncbi:MAG: hypothetical protein E4G71_01105 [Candidatus Atribacteria bacterium]|nr:MAG: hypothetical protein E4G71_01105 [Candidatus Atribacteria bacterium]
MAKKNFDNLTKNSHMGGGLSNLIPEINEKTEAEEIKIGSNEVPKTFTMLIEDYEYLQTYSRYMAFHSNSKYPLKRSLSDAINLLRETHPEVTID